MEGTLGSELLASGMEDYATIADERIYKDERTDQRQTYSLPTDGRRVRHAQRPTAIFFTMAITSLRSLSFKLGEYLRIWARKRTSSSLSCGGAGLADAPLPECSVRVSAKNCASGSSIAP